MKRIWLLGNVLPLAALLCGCGGPDPQLNGRPLSSWVQDLESMDSSARLAAIDGLAQAGQDAVPWLREIVDGSTDADDGVRIGAAQALLKIDAQQHAPFLAHFLEEDDPRGRVICATAMIRANVEPGRAVEALADVLQGDDLRMCNCAAKALTDLGPHSAQAAAALGRLARRHANADIRSRATFALVRLGPGGKDAVDDLIIALKDEDHRVREGAAYALGAIEWNGPVVMESLKTALNDPQATVRQRATKALEKLGS